MTIRSDHYALVQEEIDHCPVCGHAWRERGAAHFADCRYFSLDDDRDEETMLNVEHGSGAFVVNNAR